MQRSTDRILTTHCGSLARPRPLLEIMREKEHGRPYDRASFAGAVTDAVCGTVAHQAEVGLDVVNDGEMGKASFFTYVVERLTGYSADDGEPVMPPSWLRETEAFPDFYERYFTKYEDTVVPLRAMACTGPVAYRGHEQVAADVANIRAAWTLWCTRCGRRFQRSLLPTRQRKDNFASTVRSRRPLPPAVARLEDERC